MSGSKGKSPNTRVASGLAIGTEVPRPNGPLIGRPNEHDDQRRSCVRITLTREGHATIDIAAHEMGMGTATAHTQVAAERLGLPLEAVTFNYGDFRLCPASCWRADRSRPRSIGASVIAADRALVKELLKLAGNDLPPRGT